MEPSLRSSSYRAVECKLRRTDPALHETIQRFVESQHSDIRISQYADMNYAASKFQNDKWYWLPPIGYSGYLVFLPNMPVVWIDEQGKKSFKIQMRVSAPIYQKQTILLASLSTGDAVLRIEDVWLYAGQQVRNIPFTQRWNKVLEFYSVAYKADAALQQGLRIETAQYLPLNCVKGLIDHKTLPPMMLAQGETYPRRLRVQMVAEENKTHGTPSAQKTHGTPSAQKPYGTPSAQKTHGTPSAQKPYGTPSAHTYTAQNPPTILQKPKAITKQPQSNQVIAVPHPEYPDTYDLWINGVKKGYAAVQDIDLSKKLKQSLVALGEGKKELCVKVEWNPEFSMYEINDIA